MGQSETPNHVRDEGSFPPKRSPGAGDGHQSARTLHFVFVSLLVLFLIVHLVMLWLVGFWGHVRAMITGYIPQERNAR